MVADALTTTPAVEIEHSGLGVALIAVEAKDMRILALDGQVIDMLLERGEFFGLVVTERLAVESRNRPVKQAYDAAEQLVELLLRLIGKLEPVADIALGGLGEVECMVADTLNIVDNMEHTRYI